MTPHGELLWTPVLGASSVSILLDRPFAEACAAHQLANHPLFAQQVWELSGNEGHASSGFLDMYKGSLLPKGIYRGREGLWLTLEMATLDFSRETTRLAYHSHNADMASDQIWLMRAFQAWAVGASVLLDWGS